MPFEFEPLEIPEVVRVRALAAKDARGSFAETYKRSIFAEHGIDDDFVQDNLSRSGARVLRGLHYQLEPHAQSKLVSVLEGEIFDVAVDLRRNAPTFGRWVGATLTAAGGDLLYVPAGFAHGFCVLGEGATVLYKTGDEYAPTLERGIRWNDPELGIAWPVEAPELSDRDAALPLLAAAEHNFDDA